MIETKHERFRRIVEKRMTAIIADFKLLGNCGSKPSYEYTDNEVQQIFDELEHQMQILRERFSGKRRFSLQSNENGAGKGGDENGAV